MAPKKDQGPKITTVTIPLTATMTEMPNEVMIIVQSKVKGADGREWHTSTAGKGRDIASAINELHAEIARKPMQIAGIIERMLQGGQSDSSEPHADSEVKLDAQQTHDIDKAKQLKELMQTHGLKGIKFPFACKLEEREKIIMQAIAEKHGGATAKKDAF